MSARVVVVTGSTAGIGAAIALAFARDGDTVWVNGRHPERTVRVAESIAAQSGAGVVQPIVADIATAEGADELRSAVPDADILINNASQYAPTPFSDITDDLWRAYFEANVLSGIRLTRHYLPAMVARGWGRVVFVSSESAVNIPTDMIHYGMTKTAQLAVARGVAQSVAGTGVTVNSVLPGPTWTEGVAEMMAGLYGEDTPVEEMERRFFAEARPSSLLKRFATADEVANMVRYIGSDQASATTGAALRVDGGLIGSIIP